jgi:hypothetical protein
MSYFRESYQLLNTVQHRWKAESQGSDISTILILLLIQSTPLKLTNKAVQESNLRYCRQRWNNLEAWNRRWSIDSFPSSPGQHSAEWWSCFALIHSYALGVTAGQQDGLIGFIVDAPTYLLDYGQPFVPFAHQGQAPAANASAGAWSAHNFAIANWQRESAAIFALIDSIFKSLDIIASAWFFIPPEIVSTGIR